MLARTHPMRLLILVGLTGCSIFMRSIERPSAQVRDVSVSSAGFTGVTGQLRLDVTKRRGTSKLGGIHLCHIALESIG